MASHFPSLEEFDEGQTVPVATDAMSLDIDGADDFLSREKAMLGEDASLFATEDDNVLLGGGDILSGGAGASAQSQFESAFPALNVGNNNVGPGGIITGSSEPYLPGQNTYSSLTMQQEEEPEVIIQWRERQALEIQRRDEQSEIRKRETIEKAQRAIDDFYENYNAKRDKAIQQTRREAQEFLDSRENTVAGGTAWDRIAKLVDLSDKGARSGKSDKTRFREMLVSLRKDEKAPGASGF
ncbi:Clathrin light chain [Rhizina undulata]